MNDDEDNTKFEWLEEMFDARGTIEDIMYEIHRTINDDIDLWEMVAPDLQKITGDLEEILSFVKLTRMLRNGHD